jgi:hypothetical protein
MKPNTMFFIEFLFFDVVALAWGAWELWSVRAKKELDQAAEDAPSRTVSPDAPRHPEG